MSITRAGRCNLGDTEALPQGANFVERERRPKRGCEKRALPLGPRSFIRRCLLVDAGILGNELRKSRFRSGPLQIPNEEQTTLRRFRHRRSEQLEWIGDVVDDAIAHDEVERRIRNVARLGVAEQELDPTGQVCSGDVRFGDLEHVFGEVGGDDLGGCMHGAKLDGNERGPRPEIENTQSGLFSGW